MVAISQSSSLKPITSEQGVSQPKDKVQDSKVSKVALGLLFGLGVSGIVFTVLIAAFMFSPLAPITIPIGLIILGVVGGLAVSGVAAKVGFAVFNRPEQKELAKSNASSLPPSSIQAAPLPAQSMPSLPEVTLLLPTESKKDFIIDALEQRLEILKRLDPIHVERERLQAQLEDLLELEIAPELKTELKSRIKDLDRQMGDVDYYREDGKVLSPDEDKATGIYGELQENERKILEKYSDYKVLKNFARARTFIYTQRDALVDPENVSSVDKSHRGEARWIIDQLRAGRFKVNENNCFVLNSYDAKIDEEKKLGMELDSSLKSSPDNHPIPNQSDDLDLN